MKPACAWRAGWRWVHCARTEKYTLITCHPKRGRAGINDAGVLGRFRGVAVHDAWAPCDTYVDVAHQLCCAHAPREFAGRRRPLALGCPPFFFFFFFFFFAADALVAMQKLVGEAIAAGG